MGTTYCLDLASTVAEQFARRSMPSAYAGIPCTGFLQQEIALPTGASYALAESPTGQQYLAAIVSADPSTAIVLGWTQNDVTVEIPINLLAVITPPGGAQLYLANRAAPSNPPVPPVPVRIVLVY